jgi:hypothetical protein
MRILSFFLSLCLILTPATAQAWNARGHMTVAGVAWQFMTPRAQQRAIQLLRRNPDYRLWVERLSPAERDRIAFMEASTWPDDLRGRICGHRGAPPPPDCITDDRYDPADPEAGLNTGYLDHRLRRYWHFRDIGFSTDGTTVRPAFRVDAQTQIEFFTRSLTESGLSEEAKSFNLTWLLHLVGDVHQPLHASERFSADTPRGDGGGNGVIICRPPPAYCETDPNKRPDSLHGLWDDAIGTGDSPRSARTKADALIAQLNLAESFRSRRLNLSASDLLRHFGQWSVDAPQTEWLTESSGLAQRFAYADPIGSGKGPYFPTAEYRAHAGSIAEYRIAIAGLRLADLLNRALG